MNLSSYLISRISEKVILDKIQISFFVKPKKLRHPGIWQLVPQKERQVRLVRPRKIQFHQLRIYPLKQRQLNANSHEFFLLSARFSHTEYRNQKDVIIFLSPKKTFEINYVTELFLDWSNAGLSTLCRCSRLRCHGDASSCQLILMIAPF